MDSFGKWNQINRWLLVILMGTNEKPNGTDRLCRHPGRPQRNHGRPGHARLAGLMARAWWSRVSPTGTIGAPPATSELQLLDPVKPQWNRESPTGIERAPPMEPQEPSKDSQEPQRIRRSPSRNRRHAPGGTRETTTDIDGPRADRNRRSPNGTGGAPVGPHEPPWNH